MEADGAQVVLADRLLNGQATGGTVRGAQRLDPRGPPLDGTQASASSSPAASARSSGAVRKGMSHAATTTGAGACITAV